MGWRFKIGNISVNSDQINAIKNIKQGIDDGTIQENIERIKDTSVNNSNSNPIAFLFIGIILVAIAIFMFRSTPAMNSKYESVTGEIINVDSDYTSDGKYMYTPEIKYEIDGKQYRTYLSESTVSSTEYYTGDSIEVYYKIDNPEIIRTNSSGFFSIIIGGLGALITLLGVSAVFKKN